MGDDGNAFKLHRIPSVCEQLKGLFELSSQTQIQILKTHNLCELEGIVLLCVSDTPLSQAVPARGWHGDEPPQRYWSDSPFLLLPHYITSSLLFEGWCIPKFSQPCSLLWVLDYVLHISAFDILMDNRLKLHSTKSEVSLLVTQLQLFHNGWVHT